ncbi:MAG TPA: bile acid:sodium symporter [Thermodesulfobacteriota bacterium]|nr:bile acid:sodium symporter [Thermodesulfobacteriota bacterium]
MVRKNDLILLLVIFGSMGAGIGLPKLGKFFIPYPLYLQMFLLFLSFLKIDFVEVLKNIRRTSSIILFLCILKLFIIPVGLFFITHAIWPEYALPVLLLSGISTGVVAPFISGLLNATALLVLVMVVISTLLVPFSLPALVDLLLGETIEISFLPMVKILTMVVFLPVAAVILLRPLVPSLLKRLERVQFPVSLVIFACINLGVFAKYSSFFMESLGKLAEIILVAFTLSAIYHILGFLATWGRKKEDRLAGAISFAYINNVLIIVFSSQFFGPLSPTLAAMYMLPFFMMIVPARIVGNLLK